jgi:hypothetical protein
MELRLINNCGLGFFCDSLRVLEGYMYCKKRGIPFYLNSDKWTFGNWFDYYTSFGDAVAPEGTEQINPWDDKDKSFTVAEYRKEIADHLSFQPRLIAAADDIIKTLGSNPVAIFIRRGDKLLAESVFIHTDFYVELALSKNPSAVFVQTDDFRAFETIHNAITRRNPSVFITTTCPSTKFGSFYDKLDMSRGKGSQYRVSSGFITNTENLQYLSSNREQKPLTEYTKEEMKAHVEEMLVGIIVCQRIPIVLDHMSNAGRFITFSHTMGRAGISAIEDMNIFINGEVPLLPPYNYTEDTYITNPRFHSIHNGYI